MKKPQSDSPLQTSRHTIVRQEKHTLSKNFNAIREDLKSKDITQHVKHELQKILALFVVDSRNIDLFAQARKIFRPQTTDDETILAEQSDYVWDPEWSHVSFINIPTDISSQAISTVSIHKDYVRVYSLLVDATPLNYNSFVHQRSGNDNLNCTFINNDKLNETKNLTQQDIQPSSHFVSKEIVETITKIEAQRSSSPIQRNYTTSKLKKKPT